MRYNSFSVFLNFLLSLIIVVGSVVVYKIGNFDGVGKEELKKSYIKKDSLTFGDLPKDEQKRYISKKSLKSENYKNKIDDINIDEDVIDSVEALRDVIKDLKHKLLILQNDNIMLSNEKAELSNDLLKAKHDLETQKKTLMAKSLERINETEQQHYKNISELTSKINDLQRENIELSQGNNEKVISLKKEITDLKNELDRERRSKEEYAKDLLKKSDKRLENANQTIELLKERVVILQDNIKNMTQENRKSLQTQENKIASLQVKISDILKEKKEIVAQNTEKILQIEQKHNNRLKEINKKIEFLQNKNNDLKNSYENRIQEYLAKLEEDKRVIEKLSLESRQKSKDIAVKLKNCQEKRDTLIQEIDGYKTEIAALNNKVKMLEDEKSDISKSIDEAIAKNEKKHSANYRFLNKKIKTLEELAQRSGDIEAMNLKLQKKEQALKTLKAELISLKSEKEKFKKEEEEKIEQIRDAFNELREDVKKRENEYEHKIANLKYELKEREKYYKEKYTVKTDIKPKKLELVDFVECTDMKYGTNKVSLTCKEKVDNFLSKYDASYYYEVIPIVDNGGFASLKRLKKSKQNIIPDKEIKRLTSLANLGLGKYRAEAGGKLVLKKFGDFAKISYGVENIDKGKKRGFIIRVYR